MDNNIVIAIIVVVVIILILMYYKNMPQVSHLAEKININRLSEASMAASDMINNAASEAASAIAARYAAALARR